MWVAFLDVSQKPVPEVNWFLMITWLSESRGALSIGCLVVSTTEVKGVQACDLALVTKSQPQYQNEFV